MLKWLSKLVMREDYELREQMFRTIILVGGVATILGIAEIFLVMEITNELIPFLVLLLVVMGISLFITFKYGKHDIAAMLVGVVIIVLVFPIMICFSGGIESGATVWLALGILYTFIMFSGKKMFFFLGLTVVVYGLNYGAIYFYPELITPMPSRAAVHIDSFFSVLIVGVVSGLILKVHMRMFEAEHKLNLAQQEELKQASSSKNVFFANMSHEIRTPINSIIGLNEMILRTSKENETKEYAQDIQVASKMLLNQVNDILDFSQMEMQRMNIIPVQYRTEELFGNLVELIRVQADKKGLGLFVDIDRSIPSVLYGDEKRIKQVLLNILDNAVKYTKEGSVTMSAQGEQNEAGEFMLTVKVADTGIGIRKEELEYIYDSFNRADEKRNVRIVGTGLGLAITKQLVDLMGGEIGVDSIYTKGTIFTVVLKQKVVESAPIGTIDFLEREKHDADSYKPAFEAPEARILIVDDNTMNLRVARSLLHFTKVQVDVAGSGAECLEMTKKKYYHVILLDDMMPEMNGAETLERLRVQPNGLCRDTAVLAMTANTLSGAKQKYLELGFDGYVEKPIQGDLLEKELLRFLPLEIIEYQRDEAVENTTEGQMQRLTRKKRKKIYVTSDCICDLPQDLLEEYDIKLMYLYIKTPHGRFADTKEIDADSLTQYMTANSSSAYADNVTVEEYEEFFAEMLTQAEEVIHISLSSVVGVSYNIAVTAAKGFDHVHVIDSGQISCGQGMVTLYAAMLAMQGKSVDEIITSVNKKKRMVQAAFIMPGINIFFQNGRTRSLVYKVCNIFRLHPYVKVKPKRIGITGLLAGNLQTAWKQGIHWHLRKKRKIGKEVVFITHVGCSSKQLEWIREEILKCVPFEEVIIQKASFSSACNSGLYTVGIAYYTM